MKKRKFTTEKVDIEKDEDKPIFDEMFRCLKKLIELSTSLTRKDLEQGYYVAMSKHLPPKMNERYFYLKFKRRTS